LPPLFYREGEDPSRYIGGSDQHDRGFFIFLDQKDILALTITPTRERERDFSSTAHQRQPIQRNLQTVNIFHEPVFRAASHATKNKFSSLQVIDHSTY
jgi:hypothetical protein